MLMERGVIPYSDAFHRTINTASFNCFQRFGTKSERKFFNRNEIILDGTAEYQTTLYGREASIGDDSSKKGNRM